MFTNSKAMKCIGFLHVAMKQGCAQTTKSSVVWKCRWRNRFHFTPRETVGSHGHRPARVRRLRLLLDHRITTVLSSASMYLQRFQLTSLCLFSKDFTKWAFSPVSHNLSHYQGIPRHRGDTTLSCESCQTSDFLTDLVELSPRIPVPFLSVPQKESPRRFSTSLELPSPMRPEHFAS